jgi:hypothetical protein
MGHRGGKRPGAGRKAIPVTVKEANKSTSVEILDRLSELGIPNVTTEADYALHLMKSDTKLATMIFMDCRNRKWGRAPQAIIAEGKLTIEVKELGSGNSPSAETDTTSQVM